MSRLTDYDKDIEQIKKARRHDLWLLIGLSILIISAWFAVQWVAG